ncbi:MAG: HPr family phosphocarrier protein [Actinomycetes bacterium]|nr:HPr family phosphocarrier protein [Actinomycetes bacterium]
MPSRTALIRSACGLHARPGTGLAELALSFDSDITLTKADREVNAKEVLEILMGGMECGDEVTITATGPDETAALDAVAHYIETTEA